MAVGSWMFFIMEWPRRGKKSAPLVCITDSNSRDNDWTFRCSRIWLRFWRFWNVDKLRVWKSSSRLESGEGLFVSVCWVWSEVGEGYWRANWLTRTTPQLNSTLDHGTKCSVTLCCYQHSCIAAALPTFWYFCLMYQLQSQRRFRNKSFRLTTRHLNVPFLVVVAEIIWKLSLAAEHHSELPIYS